MTNRRLWALIALTALLITACSTPTPTPVQPGEDTGDTSTTATEAPTEAPADAAPTLAATSANPLPPATVLDVREKVGEQFGVLGADIGVVDYEQVEWPDACLGLADEGEMCAQVITPGWRMVFNVNGQELEFHTDETGENIRIVG